MKNAKRTKSGDEGNGGFGARENIAHHKQGFEYNGILERETETDGDQRLRRDDRKKNHARDTCYQTY
ncbi:hypothetical protein CupriaWKF_33960 [Cupriavidus sp. WKF15]|uniref:hypothetical protein n=1 Tax=Cupriavidus sp. WKF15 TaxID=3032282 RepID=UPI0023E11AC4|nr:hypothetical protein [Cupriavidus sp. WKF15]WER50530.1 hypothetical protein CupriaWKF_33960 [Cupriavidus sp. WKF15]